MWDTSGYVDALGSEAYKTGRVEYLEEELNQLMSEKIKMKQMLNKNLIKEY